MPGETLTYQQIQTEDAEARTSEANRVLWRLIIDL